MNFFKNVKLKLSWRSIWSPLFNKKNLYFQCPTNMKGVSSIACTNYHIWDDVNGYQGYKSPIISWFPCCLQAWPSQTRQQYRTQLGSWSIWLPQDCLDQQSAGRHIICTEIKSFVLYPCCFCSIYSSVRYLHLCGSHA